MVTRMALQTFGHSGGQQGTSTTFLIAPAQRAGAVVRVRGLCRGGRVESDSGLANMEGVDACDRAVDILNTAAGVSGQP